MAAGAPEAEAVLRPASGDALSGIQAVLDTVCDPELPFLTIRDLGILRGVRECDGQIEIVITPTYSGCPANDIIALDIANALARAGIENAHVSLERAPAWTTDWITEDGRAKLLANGIAPPARAGGKRALFSEEPLCCPQCGSRATAVVSAFGSTACKSQHRCLSCQEPFEAFKCL